MRLSRKIDIEDVEQRVAACYAAQGRPDLPPRLMVGLHYLKHAFDESVESVCERRVESPYWQYFCGEDFFRHKLPIDPSSTTRWRQRMCLELFEDLLPWTLNLAVDLKQVRPTEFREVTADTTVQPKAVTHP
ncbi:MAG: transposase [Planctomycetota bacterium]